MYVCTVFVRIKAGARIEAGSNTSGYFYIRNGLFHFEVRFSDTNVSEEYLRLREGQVRSNRSRVSAKHFFNRSQGSNRSRFEYTWVLLLYKERSFPLQGTVF